MFILLLRVCVCVCTCVYAQVYLTTLMCAEDRGQCQVTSSVVLHLILFLRQGLSLHLKFTIQTGWPLGSKDLPVSAPPVLGIGQNVSMHDFYMGGDDLNSAACY